jgi:hypothetical protein
VNHIPVAYCEVLEYADAMDKTPAQEAFETIIREHLAPRLKPHGFRKTGQLWRVHAAAGWGIIGVQKSQGSTRDHIRFTVNLGVRFDALHRAEYPDAKYMWERQPETAAQGACHEWRRIAEFAGPPPMTDLWWDVTGPASVALVVGTVLPLLERGVNWVLKLAGDGEESIRRVEVYERRER